MKTMLARLVLGMMAYSAALAMGCVSAEEGGVSLERVGTAEQALDISGAWGDSSITQSGSNLSVYMPGRPPSFGYFTGINTINVSFSGDPGCCTGIVGNGGRRIAWSNGTTWTR
jgi:hypothetical protein